MKDREDQTGEYRKSRHHPHACQIPPPHSLRLSRTQILSRKGGNRIARSDHGHDTDGFDPHTRRVTCQHRRTKTVYHGLDKKHADGNNGLLHHGRNRNLDHIAKHREIIQLSLRRVCICLFYSPLLCIRLLRTRLLPVGSKQAQQQTEGDHGGKSLRDHRRYGDTRHAKKEHPHHHKIHPDIEQGGKDEQIKRCPGIAKSIEYGRQNIVHKQKRKSQEIDLQIKHGIGKNILRRI